MQEQHKEKLSLLLDDQLDRAQAFSLLKAVRQDTELQAKLQRYSLISHALKSEQCSVASLDFVEKIHQQLDKEPIYFLPRKKQAGDLKKAGLAVAASVLLAVVWLSASQFQKFPGSYHNANTVAQGSVEAEQMNARFKEYLQAHDNVWYVSNNVGVQSYAHVASYQHK
ncbi:sigma-E factor negative regulatory protein [Methylomonas sp. MgM2]